MINPSANLFVFGDFNVHHKDWLSYSGGTGRPSELCSHFSILNYLIQMVSFPTWIPWLWHSQSCSFGLFLLTLVFLLKWLSLHREILTMFVVSVSIDFSSNSKWDVPIHHITCDYSCAGCDCLGDHLRDVPWKDIFKLSVSAVASEFRGWFQVGIDVYPHCKYQVQSHWSPFFSAACTAAIVHRNHFFHLYQQNKSHESKGKFRQSSNHCIRVLEAAELYMLIKQTSSPLPRNLAVGTFGELLMSFSTKVNLL